MSWLERRNLASFEAMLLIAGLLTIPMSLHAYGSTAPFQRGIAIHDALNWASIDQKQRRYVAPPFSDSSHVLSDSELKIIRAAGFDFVRLTVDPGPFLQFEGADLETAYEILNERIQAIVRGRLGVIVDFHPVEQDARYRPRVFIDEPDLFAKYCAMLARTAQLLDHFPDANVALEPMNEPPTQSDAASDLKWQKLEEVEYRAIREKSPKTPLILTGGRWSNFDGLMALDPRPFADDQDVYYTFHYYLPLLFTHQSLPTNPNTRLAADIPFPARFGHLKTGLHLLDERVDEIDDNALSKTMDMTRGAQNLLSYYSYGYGAATIDRDFDAVVSWAKRNKVSASRIFLGEFGVLRKYGHYNGAPNTDRLRWLTDVRTAAEKRGFFWSAWLYRGSGGFAIVSNDHTENLDPPTLSALGLRKSPTAPVDQTSGGP